MTLIDPFNITDYKRSLQDLQIFWIFSIMVAGKSAVRISQKVTEMLQGKRNEELPFEYLQRQNLSQFLREQRTGQYSRTKQAFEQSFGLDLRTCKLEELESIQP